MNAVCAIICAAILTILIHPVGKMADNRQYADSFQAMEFDHQIGETGLDSILDPVDLEELERARLEALKKSREAVGNAILKMEQKLGYK